MLYIRNYITIRDNYNNCNLFGPMTQIVSHFAIHMLVFTTNNYLHTETLLKIPNFFLEDLMLM